FQISAIIMDRNDYAEFLLWEYVTLFFQSIFNNFYIIKVITIGQMWEFLDTIKRRCMNHRFILINNFTCIIVKFFSSIFSNKIHICIFKSTQHIFQVVFFIQIIIIKKCNVSIFFYIKSV